ncbi:MAG TPA: hypothetical protein IAA07_12735 [Candidatus Lachnoclostridium stercoravium]|uniref:Uncharacterized protein n=1 Tax=Candidatus Lachnoclostridium stercoravium TaxID=2838633 RepID=A0A9D2KQU5_9FIRM|nr:hypothetical protein [Candidatus Lachnoclostridium stercoravium]
MYAIIHPISPFDPTEGTDIYFTWNGNQIHQVRCLIKENESGQTVYDRTEASMKSYYTLPADSGLEGGGRYVVYITVFDADGQESQMQHTGTPFCCFTAPSFQLSIQEGDVIRASSFLVSADYSQEEGELLNSFEFFLYSYQGALIQSSGTIYDAENISYLISGLEDGKQYFIQAAGTTVNGFPLDTGRVSFSVAYIRKQIFSTIEANNLPEIGGIELRSNIVSTEGQPQKDVVYIGGACADLRDNSIFFDSGYSVPGDNSHVFALYAPAVNARIFSLADETGKKTVDCYYRQGSFQDSDGEKGVFELRANSSGPAYVLYSNYFSPLSPGEEVFVCITRTGFFYSIQAVKKPLD